MNFTEGGRADIITRGCGPLLTIMLFVSCTRSFTSNNLIFFYTRQCLQILAGSTSNVNPLGAVINNIKLVQWAVMFGTSTKGQ